MQLTIAAALSAGAAAVSTVVAWLIWRRRPVTGTRALVGFNLAVAVWAGGNALQAASVDLGAKLFWVNVQYLGIAAVPVTVFAFAAAINGATSWTRPRRLAAIGAPLGALVLLSWTNDYHHLVRLSGTTTEVVGGVVSINRSFGPAFWAGWAYSNVLVLAGTLLVLRAVVYAQSVFRRGTAALVAGAAVPWVAHLAFVSGLSPVEPEAFFAVTGVAFAYGTHRVGGTSLRPVARNEVLELLDEGVLVVDEAGRIIDANGAAGRILDRTDVEGTTVEEAFGPHGELLASYRAGEERTDLRLADDRRVELRLATLAGLGGEERRVVLLHDVTDLRAHERDLKRQNERLEHIRGALAHDLRNPLNVAQGYLDIARARRSDDGEVDALERIDDAHDRIETIIDDVLAMARTNEVEPEDVDLGTMARDAWNTVETGGARLDVEESTAVQADPARLQQLLENLFANAVEHGVDGSRDPSVAVESVPEPGAGDERAPTADRGEPDDTLTVRLGRLEDVLRSDGSRTVGFYVEDDGPGIPADDRNLVFDRGHSSREEGTGLGLAIVEEIAEAHGWGVRLAESDTGGARFEFVGVS